MGIKDFILKISIAAIALLLPLGLLAQGGNTVSLKLTDKTNSESVAFATVSVTPKGADKALKYALTDEKGEVKFADLKSGTYTIKAELMGYKPYTQEIKLDKNLALGEIKMDVDNQVLDAASVSAVGNPIVVKKDTIEYNASSFKTTDNDMLEDLLKKLPGVEVNSDGSVTANGKTISKITIDGKTFFLDDPSLATKNIPAKIVNKVKVVEKKSDQALFTGIDDGEEETVIDLSVRPGMMKGVFGNVMAGGGHDVPVSSDAINDYRYQGAAMVGRFTDKSQISILLNGNNTNNRGFNDMAGSMMQGMRGGGGGMGRGTGGWGGGNGITTSWMGGVNGAWTLLDGNMDLGGNYLYNGTNKYVEEGSSKTTFLDNGNTLKYNSIGRDRTLSQGHRFGIRLEHKFSDKTSILFQPQFNFGKGSFNELSRDTTYANNASVPTNKGFASNTGDNKNWSTSGFLLFRQRIGHKAGRTISLMSRYSFSENKLGGYNQSLSQTLNESSLWTGDPTNQRYDSHSNGSSLSARLAYTEPIVDSMSNGGKLFLEVNASYAWNKNTTVKDVFNSGEYSKEDFGPDNLFYNPNGEYRDETYSNNILNEYKNQEYGTNIQYQTEKLRLQAGAAFLPTITNNTTNGKDYYSKVYNWSPQAMFNYEFNDNSNLRFFYRGRSSQPSTSQLMPVPDNTNPLSISFGNPYLKPYFNHNLRGMFGYTNKETFFSIHGNMNAGLTQNAITNAVWYNSAGVQYAMPVNGKATGNASIGAFLNAPIAKSNFSIQNNMNISYTSSASYVGKSEKSEAFTQMYYNEVTKEFDYESFNRDFFDHSQTGSAKYELEDFFTNNKTQSLSVMERLKATYRNDFINIEVSGRTRFNKPWYTIVNNGTQNTTWNNQIEAELTWTSSFGLGVKPEYSFNWYRGYTTPQESTHILELEISQLIFKNKCTLAVKGYDLLNQTKNLYVTDTANYHQETRNNTLGRYIIFSLTYRFGTYDKSRRQGGMDRGPMGPPPPGH